jgi:hypothetical protein
LDALNFPSQLGNLLTECVGCSEGRVHKIPARLADTILLWTKSRVNRALSPLMDYHYIVRLEGSMLHKPQRETPIERIYREVMGHKMPLAIRRVLLRKRKPKRSPV